MTVDQVGKGRLSFLYSTRYASWRGTLSVARALVDTGAIVALVNRADRFHPQAAAWFRGRLLTTEAVITETAYVLAASPEHQQAALTWIQRAREAGILQVVAMEDHRRARPDYLEIRRSPLRLCGRVARLAGREDARATDRDDRPGRLLGVPGGRATQVSDTNWRALTRGLLPD
ncbi:MAG TPA: hypothetical protein DHV08_07375 [Rhodocyclaceae bacterium]|nr:hypothetical protein [Rhodocyclaceae bacterium]